MNDRSVTRAGYRTLFEESPDLEVTASVGTIHQAVTAMITRRPDIVVVDSQSQEPDAVEIIRAMAAAVPGDPPPFLLLIDTFDDRVHQLLHLGVRGLLLDRSTPEEIASAVRLVAAGYALLLPAAKHCTDAADALDDEEPVSGLVPSHLTRRESDVLRLIARGFSNAEISDALSVSESTVKSHVQRMLDKLELRNRVHAVIYAYEAGLVSAGAVAS